jgi:GNAT superfamily N-acetyltransferase
MAFTCREATAADQARVVELLAAQLDEHSLAPARTALEAAAAALIGEPRLGRIFVAEIGGRIVGVAALSWSFSLEHGGRGAWLDELYVVPEQRGRGIGAALLDAVRAAAAAGGALAMDLEVEAGHERVASLYERHGFSRHRRQRWFLRL